jgi:hypothetical protein
VQTTFFTPKDTLPTTNPAKTIFGAAYDVEFGNIASAIQSKYDNTTTAPSLLSLTIGTPTGGNLGAGSINAQSVFVNNVAVLTSLTGAVTSITGTANQIAASPSTGAVTLSLPAAIIAPGSVQATGDFIVGGNISGTATSDAYTIAANPTATLLGGAYLQLFGSTSGAPGLIRLGNNSVNYVTIAAAGNVAIAAPSAGSALTITGVANTATFAQNINVANVANQSNGLRITAGTSTTDFQLALTNAAGTINTWLFSGDGSVIASGTSPQGAGTINATGLFINGVAVGTSSTGSFTGTITGCTTAPTVTCQWTKVGTSVTLRVGGLTALSNAATLTLTGLPAAIQPATAGIATEMIAALTNNSVGLNLGSCTVAGGTLTFLLANAGTTNLVSATGFFSGGGQKGWAAFTVTYDVN